jgi:hypothetical protein
MRIASVTMVGQFPDATNLHVRNLRWALSEQDHVFIVTTRALIRDFNLRNDARSTYIAHGEHDDILKWFAFWKEFPRITRDHGIDPEWFLFMEQDIWFYQKANEQSLPHPKEIRSYLPLQLHYHSVMVDEHVYHPRVWEGGMLIHGSLVRRAVDFGIDFSGHDNMFTNKDKEYWDGLAGGTLSLRACELPDTMDEFTLYCALVEKTRVTHSPMAVHLQGPEAFHRYCPELYSGSDEERLRALAPQWSYYFCVYAAVAVYFIAGNWKKEVDWKRIQLRFRPEFEKLIPTAKEWMKPEEYERLEIVVAGFQ